MKALLAAFLIISIFGCEITEPNAEARPEAVAKATLEEFSRQQEDFSSLDTLTVEEAKQIYQSAPSFMRDLRRAKKSAPFRLVDIITEPARNDLDYPYTRSEGITRIYYGRQLVFENSWNNPYATPVNMMTQAQVGEVFGFNILKIQNNSYDPSREYSYWHEKRLLIERNGKLDEIDLYKIGIDYYFGEIKKAHLPNTVVMSSATFARTSPQQRYYIFYNLKTKQYKKFVE